MSKNIAVIGGGLSGLTTIKQLKDEGHRVTCFEGSDDFGGVFRGMGSCYEGLKLTVSNYFMAYSDFVPTNQRYRFWNQKEYRQYLGDYAKNFDLDKHVRLKHRVLAVVRKDSKWAVTTECDGVEKTDHFDGVAVCSGMFVHKKVPEIEGLKSFRGEVIHSQDFQNAARFADKRVLCVGLGESSSDVTSEISEVARECFLSLRRYPAVAPRYVPFQKDTYFTIDSSWNTVRNFNNVPKTFHKRLTGKIFEQYKKSRNPDTRLRGTWLRKAGPTGDQVINKNERVFANIVDGKVTPNMSGIERFTKNGVVYKDGEKIEVDAVVFCTGYETRFPFMTGHETTKLRGLYLQMFDTKIGDSLAYIGFARPQQGGIPAIAEMQARYFAQLLSKNCELPSAETQLSIAERHEEHWQREYPITPKAEGLVNYVHYMDLLASQVGCLPKRPSYLSDFILRIKLDYNPIFSAQYRLNGPHASPEETKSFLKSFPNIFSAFWIAYLMFARFWLGMLRNRKRVVLLSMREADLRKATRKKRQDQVFAPVGRTVEG